MNDDDFEWDEAKAESNLKKHGVSFVAATRIFDDAFALDRIDTKANYGEHRFVIIGFVNGVLLTAAYTERDGRTRLISARKATRNEEAEYHRGQKEE